jgi:parvulin-like peptidyl-prolyl isomerase
MFKGLFTACACGIGYFAIVTAARCESAPAAAKAATNPATVPEKTSPVAAAGDVVARVNDQPIYQRQVDGLLAAATHGQIGTGPVADRLRAIILAELVERQLVLQNLARTQQAATKQDIDTEVGRLKAELERTKQSWEQFLARSGQTESTLRGELEWKLTWEKYFKQQATDDALKAYFNEHARDFDGTELRVSHILLRPPGPATEETVANLVQQAEKIRADILSGKTSFEAAAQEDSAGPSRAQGGDLGFIPRHGIMDEAFARSAFALEKDGISLPVVTSFGIHLIRVTDVKAGTKKWSDVRGELEKALSQKIFHQLARKESAAAKVEFTGQSPYLKPGTMELVLPKS